MSCVRERFRINDTFISEEEFARISQRIMDVLGDNTITYFEFTTALAFLWFQEADLDLVILETGLGGRLDATNVVTPLVSVVTSISMDHEAYLGTTLSEVAGEKAGIIKPGIPVVAAHGPADVVTVLKTTTAERKSPLYLLGEDFTYSGESNDDWSWNGGTVSPGVALSGLKCSMRGAYQRENASLVIAVLELLKKEGLRISEDNLKAGLASVKWPGRLEYIVLEKLSRKQITGGRNTETGYVRYLLDGAHNPAGLKNLSLTLAEEYQYKKLIVVWGAMIDKDIASGLASMLPLADTLILTTPVGDRSARPEQLAAFLPKELQLEVVLESDVQKALEDAEHKASEDDIIVVAGSLYLVGAVRKILVGELVGQE